MTHIVKKPAGTFYSDFTFFKGYLYAIFEHDMRVSNIKVCKTDITNKTWIIRDADGKIAGFNGDLKETPTELLITLYK